MEDDTGSETPSATNQPSTGTTPQASSASASTSAALEGHSGPPSSGTSTAGAASAAQSSSSKRRRGLGVVTPNACTECRKKRAKCDGQRPCGRCKSQRDVECVYEIPVRQSKENLRTEIEILRQRQRSSDQVFAALVRPELWEEVLSRLRGGQSIENISDWVDCIPPAGAAAGSLLSAFAQHPAESGISVGSSVNPVVASFHPGSGGRNLGGMGLGMGSLGSSAGQQPQQPPPQSQQHQRHQQHPQQQQQQHVDMRREMGQGSPWPFRSHSQAGSTSKSGSRAEPMNWAPDISGPPQSRVGVWADSLRPGQMSGAVPRFWGVEQVLSPLNGPEMRSPSETWTSITGDINLVQHLLALYFCWEYPTFASLSKEHFLRDFQDARPRYCSSILINALLALGCRFSNQPMTRANPDDPYTSGDHFFKESQRLFYQETDHHSLTTIQALGIMSIREASCGRDSESWYYAGQSVRLAIEMGLHRVHDDGDEDELAVQSATFWGAFALDHAWSLATGSLPQCSCFPQLPPKPGIIGDIEASLWVPYTDDGAPLQRSCEQPSNVRSVYKCFCELSELVHQSLYILHSPGRPLTARDLLSIYTQYLNWYDRIPEVLRLGHNFTPAVLFAHMYYHFAILLLFRPLIKLRILGSKIAPRDVCTQAADAIQGLLRSYSRLYTLRRTPSFVPYFVLTSAIMHLAVGAANASVESEGSSPRNIDEQDVERAAKVDRHVSDAISQGIADLTEMAPCHHFAEQALNILRYLAKKWNIEVDIEPGKCPPEEYDKLVRPYTSSLNFFAPNVQAVDFICDWGMGRGMIGTGDQPTTKKAADSIESPMFWPFPLQGRPMLPAGEELKQAGFALL